MQQTIGTKVETPNQVIVKLPDGVYQLDRTISGLVLPSGINPSDYAMIHSLRTDGSDANYSAASAISMNQGFNRLKYEPAHVEVLKLGLAVSTPAQFMPHLRNVNDALNGRGVLYDAVGNLIEGERLEQYSKILNYGHWVWLNASFPKGGGFLGLDLATITGLDDEENPIKRLVPLERCLEDDGWADIDSLNSQGFPTRKAGIDKYEPGKTLYFLKPQRDRVAGSCAVGVWLCLLCDRNPLDQYSSLGVFPVFNAGSLAH
ncbi:hypothetical protein HYT23_06735 [Candidatus Pacearchaeota archaeon]|nr:hypothetical protein [Candidatus Pacearchaeota archaeon]